MMRIKVAFWVLAAASIALATALFPTEGIAKRPDIQKHSNIAYGSHKDQVLDVYTRDQNSEAAIIVMVHGGAWRTGDKASRAVISNKVRHWSSKGVILVSVNYRLLPDTRPYGQAQDVAQAIAYIQQHAKTWGGSADKVTLMGHSAGAHLVALIASDPALQAAHQLKPWLGTVAIDSAAYDVEKIMQADRVPWFYTKAFGRNPEYWQKTSPYHALNNKIHPFLAICSLQRKDGACEQAKRFIVKSGKLGTQGQLIEINQSHRELNIELGRDNDYTVAVDEFLASIGAL